MMNSVANWKITLTKKARTKCVKNSQGKYEKEMRNTSFCQKHQKPYVTDENNMYEHVQNHTDLQNMKPTYRQHHQEIDSISRVNKRSLIFTLFQSKINILITHTNSRLLRFRRIQIQRFYKYGFNPITFVITAARNSLYHTNVPK